MTIIGTKYKKIIGILLEKDGLSSSSIHGELSRGGEEVSLVTVKRTLSKLADMGLLVVEGTGPATRYSVSILGRLSTEIDAKAYCSVEPDKRYGMSTYNFGLLSALPQEIFLDQEISVLEEATKEYHRRTSHISEAIQKKELERLVVELSWKSSKIEGNTYTLIDTEKLLLEHKEAPGHSKSEGQMILNHKDAFTFIHERPDRFKKLTQGNLQELHAILVKDLSVSSGFRKTPVGVLGSKYRPPDNVYQISEAAETLARAVSYMRTPYAKALVALLGISYIQPFEDGNKRTARLMANALLLAHGCAPLSYRGVDEEEYREATLVFYELNSMIPFKKIFISQYDFAARNYAVK